MTTTITASTIGLLSTTVNKRYEFHGYNKDYESKIQETKTRFESLPKDSELIIKLYAAYETTILYWDKAVLQLVEMASQNPNISKLKFTNRTCHMDFRSDLAIDVAKILKEMHQLESFSCRTGSRGAIALAKALKECPNLKTVDIQPSYDSKVFHRPEANEALAGFKRPEPETTVDAPSPVEGDITIDGCSSTISGRNIKGTLTCTSNDLKIENSQIDTLIVKCDRPLENKQIGGTVILGSVKNIVMGKPGTSEMLIDGIPLSQYKQMHGLQTTKPSGKIVMSTSTSTKSTKMTINGVVVEEKSTKESKEKMLPSKDPMPTQTLTLHNTTVRNIVFESANYKVDCEQNSKVTGEVTRSKPL